MGQPDPSRYVRQAALPEIGAAGQERLASSRALVVGCGALVVVDRDVLELHNLQRQLLFDEADVRERLPKAVAAARRLRAVNSDIRVEGIVADVTPANAAELVGEADVVLDGTDNFETRYLVNDASVRCGVPWVYGGVLGTEGTIMAVRPKEGPCLRCVLAEPPAATDLPTCETRGVLGAAVVWVAALQVAEATRILTGAPVTEHRITSLDVWQGAARSGRAERRAGCPCCDLGRFEFLDGGRGSSTVVMCGRNAVQVTPERQAAPSFERLAERLGSIGRVSVSGMVLELSIERHRLVVFPDGRVLVFGTVDAAEARGLVAKYVGM